MFDHVEQFCIITVFNEHRYADIKPAGSGWEIKWWRESEGNMIDTGTKQCAIKYFFVVAWSCNDTCMWDDDTELLAFMRLCVINIWEPLTEWKEWLSCVLNCWNNNQIHVHFHIRFSLVSNCLQCFSQDSFKKGNLMKTFLWGACAKLKLKPLPAFSTRASIGAGRNRKFNRTSFNTLILWQSHPVAYRLISRIYNWCVNLL